MSGLEDVYRRHHTKDNSRKRNHAILAEERARFIREAIPAGATVIDIGCRDGELVKYYNEGGRYSITGLDIDSEALAIAAEKTGITTLWCDLNAPWNVPGPVGGVVACEVIEHLYHPSIVFSRIHDVLAPGGVVVGSVPHAFNIQSRVKYICGSKRGTAMSDPTHINHFTPAELAGFLSERFTKVTVIGVSSPRYRFLQGIFPYLFCHTLLFKATK